MTPNKSFQRIAAALRGLSAGLPQALEML